MEHINIFGKNNEGLSEFNYSLRPAKVEDIPTINKLLNEHLSFGISTEEIVLEKMNSRWTRVSVAEYEGEIIGLMRSTRTSIYGETFNKTYKPVDVKFLENNGVYKVVTIDSVVVVPEHRMNGVMHALVEQHKVKEVATFATSWDFDRRLKKRLENSSTLVNIVENYFLEDKLPCPYCGNICQCQVVQVLMYS